MAGALAKLAPLRSAISSAPSSLPIRVRPLARLELLDLEDRIEGPEAIAGGWRRCWPTDAPDAFLRGKGAWNARTQETTSTWHTA